MSAWDNAEFDSAWAWRKALDTLRNHHPGVASIQWETPLGVKVTLAPGWYRVAGCTRSDVLISEDERLLVAMLADIRMLELHQKAQLELTGMGGL